MGKYNIYPGRSRKYGILRSNKHRGLSLVSCLEEVRIIEFAIPKISETNSTALS